jgi:hypothetical protein
MMQAVSTQSQHSGYYSPNNASRQGTVDLMDYESTILEEDEAGKVHFSRPPPSRIKALGMVSVDLTSSCKAIVHEICAGLYWEFFSGYG